MLLFRLIILFWVTTRTGLHPLMLNEHQFSRTVQSCNAAFPFCLKRSDLVPVSLRPF